MREKPRFPLIVQVHDGKKNAAASEYIFHYMPEAFPPHLEAAGSPLQAMCDLDCAIKKVFISFLICLEKLFKCKCNVVVMVSSKNAWAKIAKLKQAANKKTQSAKQEMTASKWRQQRFTLFLHIVFQQWP